MWSLSCNPNFFAYTRCGLGAARLAAAPHTRSRSPSFRRIAPTVCSHSKFLPGACCSIAPAIVVKLQHLFVIEKVGFAALPLVLGVVRVGAPPVAVVFRVFLSVHAGNRDEPVEARRREHPRVEVLVARQSVHGVVAVDRVDER
eukprot:7317779-Prymnesium_polylepis.1